MAKDASYLLPTIPYLRGPCMLKLARPPSRIEFVWQGAAPPVSSLCRGLYIWSRRPSPLPASWRTFTSYAHAGALEKVDRAGTRSSEELIGAVAVGWPKMIIYIRHVRFVVY